MCPYCERATRAMISTSGSVVMSSTGWRERSNGNTRNVAEHTVGAAADGAEEEAGDGEGDVEAEAEEPNGERGGSGVHIRCAATSGESGGAPPAVSAMRCTGVTGAVGLARR
jgi:hypothetical protein